MDRLIEAIEELKRTDKNQILIGKLEDLVAEPELDQRVKKAGQILSDLTAGSFNLNGQTERIKGLIFSFKEDSRRLWRAAAEGSGRMVL
jgi:hypothetical protein